MVGFQDFIIKAPKIPNEKNYIPPDYLLALLWNLVRANDRRR